MKYIDLSIDIENGVPCDPPSQMPQITYSDHKAGIKSMLERFPGTKEEDFPNGWAFESVRLSTHSGTHMDAPYHYAPIMNQTEKAWTIDQMPLEWCVGNAVVLDFQEKPDGYLIGVRDVQEKLEQLGHRLRKGDILLINTGANKNLRNGKYLMSGAGFDREATLWIIDQGVHVVGTDAWSWDCPLWYMAERFRETGDKNILWQGHFAGREKCYFQIEKLVNLDKIPALGAKFYCFPVKIKGASAGWIRAIAEIEDID